jgi:hypothetical protein
MIPDQSNHPLQLTIRPLDPGRWEDLAALYGEHGAVESHRTHGLLAYIGDQPVGWCSLDPREKLPRLQSRYWRSIDDQIEVYSSQGRTILRKFYYTRSWFSPCKIQKTMLL